MNKKIEIVTAKKYSSEGVSYETTSIDSYFGLNGSGQSDGALKGEKALSHSFLFDTLRKVLGKTLTIIDSSIIDKQQNKAMKDLVRNVISDEMDFSSQMAFDQEVITKLAEEHFEGKTDEEILESSFSIEEALGVK